MVALSQDFFVGNLGSKRVAVAPIAESHLHQKSLLWPVDAL